MRAIIKRAMEFIFHGVRPQDVRANITISDRSSCLKGKNIIITGGGRGLGFYIAERCVADGANVLITGRKEDTLIEASKKLNNCHYIPFDVTDFAHIKPFFDKCELLFGSLPDCLVNNAGISLHEGTIEQVTMDTYDRQFDTNLKGPYFLSQEFIQRYKIAGKTNGSIIFVSSERGLYCDDQPYGMIKAGLNSLTEALGRRYINIGLRVNAVAPGVTVSDLTKFDKEGNLSRPRSCGGRVYLGEEVAEVVSFLLSDASGCISSNIIPCNRGNHLRSDIQN